MAILCLKILFHLHLDPSSDEFTNVDFCPACYGNDLCPKFFHGEVSLLGISKLKYLKNSKNVFFGKLSSNRVILKKLAQDSEILNMDKLLCKKANLKPCKPNEAVRLLTVLAIEPPNEYHLMNLIKVFEPSTDITRCPSERLLTYLYNQLNAKRNFIEFEEMEFHQLGQLLYSLLLNPEAIIMQAFSQAEGWPFPQYYGSCGRVIVEEYVRRTIAYFEDSSWEQRVDISYQLLLIAQMLTENASDPNNQNKLHHSKGEFCKDCMNFSFEDLCNTNVSDHNYYAICKGLLIPGSYFSAEGLLHDIPKNVDIQTNLSHLINECANPTKLYNRFQVLPKLLQVLKSLL
ncbi:divergent protein kinase domain 2A [Caerostris extrusa]|uniref:Divergent protein kinase domain 2A n=1 Tax=Caerostris extrusa TaxID=172846 RepID=A0AAV4UGL0_CAEEX|nr:divergent protein kinase domain 2A [Caerostris extrusa]